MNRGPGPEEEEKDGMSDDSASTTPEVEVKYSWVRTKGQKAQMDIRCRELFWKDHGRQSVSVARAAKAQIPDSSGTLPDRHAALTEAEGKPKYLFGKHKKKWKEGIYPPTVKLPASSRKRPRGGKIQQRGKKKKS